MTQDEKQAVALMRYSAIAPLINGSLTPVRLLNKQDNSMIKREKVYLCRGDE